MAKKKKCMTGVKEGMFPSGQAETFKNRNKRIGGPAGGKEVPSVSSRREIKRGG